MSRRATLDELIGVAAQTSRATVSYGMASLIGLGTHVGLLLLFAAFEVWPMVLFNLGSVLCFVVVRMLFLRRRMLAGMVLAVSEVILHQILAVWFCGWAPGFQYYLLGIVPLCQMLPGVGNGQRLVFAGLPAATFIVLVFAAPEAPTHGFPPGVAAGLGIVNLMVSFFVCWVFIHYYRRGAEGAERALGDLWARSERLLHGILPPAVVDRLRERPGVVADRFDEATVLFADLVGFTPLAQKKSPEELVVLLDEIFARFDDLAEARGLEKIKTIGDAYMVASGVPASRPDHAAALADFALAARDELAALARRLGEPLALRIGMHTGPVIAGVIGKTKFAYDLWGDAVNTAARMESHGDPGRIHVTAATAEVLAAEYDLEPRGAVDIKGKGRMETYWLLGRRDAVAPARRARPEAAAAAS